MAASCHGSVEVGLDGSGARVKHHNLSAFAVVPMLRMRLRFTFIEFVPAPDETPSPRSSSEPPGFMPVAWQRDPDDRNGDATVLEPHQPHTSEGVSDGVPENTPSLQLLPSPAETDDEAVEAQPPCPSLGSVGHPQLCYRRCVRFATGECNNGSSCHFCHLRHSGDRRLERADRQLFLGLSRFDLLRTTLRVLKGRSRGRREEAEPVFLLLASELEDARQEHRRLPQRSTTDQELQGLQASLYRTSMNFAALLAAVAWRLRPETRNQLEALLAHMREEARR